MNSAIANHGVLNYVMKLDFFNGKPISIKMRRWRKIKCIIYNAFLKGVIMRKGIITQSRKA